MVLKQSHRYMRTGLCIGKGVVMVCKVVSAGGSNCLELVIWKATGNNSQMDKLWSLLPIAYTWIIAYYGGLQTRLVVMAILATLWGAQEGP